jgi:hypothetical protein
MRGQRREEVLAGICYFFTQQESLDLSPEPNFRTKSLLIDRDRLRHRLLDRRLDERPSHPWAGPNVSKSCPCPRSEAARPKSRVTIHRT